ncbi:MAG: hypothetical protein FRX48_07450 [Lasallia pustulata]|uniref:Uncharacterized protein n=1 Tax=Lasallia pustulata TaxID=136370 RepID=A0A5M8PJT5_9LECA|nr:MAG: hypothetical protein FRX48_07450 [Lasallia pustulata]
MSQTSFLAVESAFNLPPTTLEAAFDYNGVYARYYYYSDDDDESVESIGLVLKFPQSQYAGFYMVSLTYTPATQTTNALIIGAMPIQKRWIIDNIEHSVYLWQHPLLLPCILFNNHLQNTQHYCPVLGGKIVEVEGDTGFVQAGRLTWADPSAVPKWSKLDLEGLTRRLHSCLAELIFADVVSHFRIDCAGFLLKTRRYSSIFQQRRTRRSGEMRGDRKSSEARAESDRGDL